jgi:predicted Zn-dependent protease
MAVTDAATSNLLRSWSWLPLLAGLTACATNPATGKRQLSLVSEAQEIQMGRQAAASVAQTIGFVEDEALQKYVAQIGQAAAAVSERPSLPWEFHVIDDPTPNAFALPGGFIYVTRGMLGLMNSEAELAGVLGHEIAHVTGRHSANQISKAQLTQLGMGLGSIFVPELQPYQALLGAGLELLFLKYSRNHEREADELGFEYVRKRGYDVAKFDDVFVALERVGQQESSGGGLPSWFLTHPAPAERVKSAEARIAAAGVQPNARVGQDTYLQQIDDLVYGKDPRDGFFRGATFYHPKLRFQMTFPEGWQTENLAQAVVGVARDNRAALELTLAGRERPEAAIRRFFSIQGIAAGRVVRADFNGAPAAIGEFQAQTEGGVVQGLAAFVSRGDVTYQLIGYTAAQLYGTYAATIERAMRSFAPVDDPAILNVQPQRIDVVKIQESMSVGEF